MLGLDSGGEDSFFCVGGFCCCLLNKGQLIEGRLIEGLSTGGAEIG